MPRESSPSGRCPSSRGLFRGWFLREAVVLLTLLAVVPCLEATPANRAALVAHYDRFLAKELNRCTTCHLPSERNDPLSLDEFPHNPFGHRLKLLGDEQAAAGKPRDLAQRVQQFATEDSDGDGVANEAELLLGHNPGQESDTPTTVELANLETRRAEFTAFLAAYRWRPFDSVERPPVPTTRAAAWGRNPIDAFIAAGHGQHGLQPRGEAPKEALLRRVYLDLIGLPPTPEEQRAFLGDASERAYEKVVERLLNDPRHGERWGRHWMDVWRYSDWAGWTEGKQVRDSQRHIWRWRDWIVESLNADKGYDRMLLEMLAADEFAPLDTEALRATGFLVRNYKMLSREQWMEDTIKHTSQAFLGVTMGCAKCHDHMTDPISQADYYRMRAIFDPHHVRTDRVPGEVDRERDGLVRVFDTLTNNLTPLLVRGDERHPDTNRLMSAGVPAALTGATGLARTGGLLAIEPVKLPFPAVEPDHREFVRNDVVAEAEHKLSEAKETLAGLLKEPEPKAEKLAEQELLVALADAKLAALRTVLAVEVLEDAGRRDSADWTAAATEAERRQRIAAHAQTKLAHQRAAVALAAAHARADEAGTATTGEAEAESPERKKENEKRDKAAKELESARSKLAEAEKALAAADEKLGTGPSTAYQPRERQSFPAESTGRRLAFARWVTDAKNPLTARVAMNHVWLRHFGRGLVPTPADFGRNGKPPTHPELLDWLAAEFMARGWSLKEMHRLMVTSRTYRMASTPDEANTAIDPDNHFLWRMNSRRLEAEAVRDSLLFASGALDLTMGGPEIDQQLGLVSPRRSLYLRLAAEKEVEFLRIFDGPMVTECYERRPSVMPQQALALANSELARREAEKLAERLTETASDDETFVTHVYRRVLARAPQPEEVRLCREFLEARPSTTSDQSELSDEALAARRRAHLILVLFNHNDFVTVR